MKKFALLIILLPFILAFYAPSTFEVIVKGNYLDAVAGGSLEKISIESLKLSGKSFGIGLEAETQAEIIVYKGKAFKSSFNNDGITTQRAKNVTASYLVYANIRRWEKYQLPSTIRSLEDLEMEINKAITDNNYTDSGTIPFLVVGNPISANWHIELEPGTDRQLNNRGFFFQDLIRAVGFYSADQPGVITDLNSKIHIHVTNKKREIVGHLDDIKMAGGMTLWMPKLD